MFQYPQTKICPMGQNASIPQYCILLTRRFDSFDQSNEKAFMPSVSSHRYLELNFLDFQLVSEANLLTDIFPQRCSRILIKC